MQTEYLERYKSFGLKVAYYRKKAGYTQEALAEEIGRSRNFISKVESISNVAGVSLETLFRMADVLQVSPSKFLEDD